MLEIATSMAVSLIVENSMAETPLSSSADGFGGDIQVLPELIKIGQAILNAPPEPQELAEVAYLETARLLETDFFQLGVFEGNRYRPLIWVRDGNRQDNVTFDLEEGDEGIIGWVRNNGTPLLIDDYESQSEDLPAQPRYQAEDPPASAMFAPLISSEQVIGIIGIQSRRKSAFDSSQLDILSNLATFTAVALDNISLQTEIEDRTLQLVLIQEISRRLISLQPLSDRLTQVVSLISEAFDYQSVYLFEKRGEVLELRASSLTDSQEVTKSQATLEAAQEGQTAIGVTHSIPEKIETEQSTDDNLQEAPELAVPLKVEERILGVLDIRYNPGQKLTPEQITLSEMLASQMAIAMLEAKNFAQQQEEAWITTVLLEVARHAARPGDPEQALQAVLRLTTLLAGTDWAILLLPADDGTTLRVGPAAGIRRSQLDQIAEFTCPVEGLNLPRLDTEREEPISLPLPQELAAIFNETEAMAIVLSDGLTVLGVLLLESQPISGRRTSLMAGIAHQISLRLENSRLIDEAATKRSLERELVMARNIQASFLPLQLPTHPNWEVGAMWRVAREVGGDFYDFIPLPEGPRGPRWGVVIADVADKGIPAALYMALSRTIIRSVATTRIDPAATLERVNRLLLVDSNAELFVSVFYAIWEPASGGLTFANAGHNPPLLLRPNHKADILREHGIVLGVLEDANYETYERNIEPGEMLVLYTDGVTEAMGKNSEMFGLHRLENLVLGLENWSAQNVAEHIASRVADFLEYGELADDLTTITLRRTA
jgi:serine phosphatase RsbU (regulator of sigma subunit)/GAF domain-containing protein